jgi:hypothetical protein
MPRHESTRSTRTLACSFTVITLLAGCGGGSNPSQPGPAVLRVAGSYLIVQQRVSSTCGDTGTPPTVNGTVTHSPGGGTFVLSDTGGTTFNGTVASNGDFTGNAVFGPDSGGQTYTQQLVGRFTAGGFTARLAVDVQPRNCQFTRDWTATKQGSPNTIP